MHVYLFTEESLKDMRYNLSIVSYYFNVYDLQEESLTYSLEVCEDAHFVLCSPGRSAPRPAELRTY